MLTWEDYECGWGRVNVYLASPLIVYLTILVLGIYLATPVLDKSSSARKSITKHVIWNIRNLVTKRQHKNCEHSQSDRPSDGSSTAPTVFPVYYCVKTYDKAIAGEMPS